MPSLNWGMVQDGGTLESLMHALLFAEDSSIILFGRPGKDAGQDARSGDGTVVYQAKYRQGLVMDDAVALALGELKKIKAYRQPAHNNHRHWQSARRWILVANLSINPNDDTKWQDEVVPAFRQEGLDAEYWYIETLEGKLAQHSEVRDVFFGGENRVLVGLKEAHDLLSTECVGNLSLDIPMVGRDDELNLIRDFASSGDKRVLPVIGPGGIGKSRLLYEGLVSLSQDGWRVLWGLPATMANSSQWFRLLNGAQKTCVALDAPDDPRLLRAVVEQLAMVERRNWRVIIAYRTEKAEALHRFRTHLHVHEPIQLEPLDECSSQALLNGYLKEQAQPSWLHSVYTFTNGVPGWLCLIAELANKGTLSALPPRADDVAALYVQSCLEGLDTPYREQGRTLLSWLALWGTMTVESGSKGQVQYSFLETKGIPAETARDLLRMFVGTGIVRNWGVGKRLFAIEPLIVRQQILSSRLFSENGGVYEVSQEGRELVDLLVKGVLPAADSILNTLSQLARSRLDEPEVSSFLKPVFDAMAEIVAGGSGRDQNFVADLVEKAGAADPESALDVLVSIRENTKDNMEPHDPDCENRTFTYGSPVDKLPWILFNIAEHVSDPTVAGRYINEFGQLVELEDAGTLPAARGKTPRELLKRILIGSSNSGVFAQPAYDIAAAEFTSPTGSSFVGLVIECLLNPIRKTVDWVANWTITITEQALLPGCPEWNLAADIREKAFAALQNDPHPEFRGLLWAILAGSHHAFHRTVLQGKLKGPAAASYRAVLDSDLKLCAAILKSPPVALSIEEATHAREMWVWYLKYGREEGPVKLAHDCEDIYNALSPWRLHDFFRSGTQEELAPETDRLAALLRKDTNPNVFNEFFEEAKRYLDAARQAKDMADDGRISELANACADLFVIDDGASMNPLTAFTFEVLGQSEPPNPLALRFVVRVCQRCLLSAKSTGRIGVEDTLSRLLNATQAKSRLLRDLYDNVHPSSTGILTRAELKILLGHENDFSGPEWFLLLGAFYSVDPGMVQERLLERLNSLLTDPAEMSRGMSCFIRSAYVAALRYDWLPAQMPVVWILHMITRFSLNGQLLGMYELEWMRDQASFRLNMVRLAELIRSRTELEQRHKPYEHFEIVPHNFAIGDWVIFDANDEAEVNAFHEFCRMALGCSFTAIYWMPKYLPQIDSSGQHVADFVTKYLTESSCVAGDVLARLGHLASCYGDDSPEWAAIARPICEKAKDLKRAEREKVYFGLSRKETGVLHSLPGEVPQYFIAACEKAARLRDVEPTHSPLGGYRKWALARAEAELRREQGCVEEDLADG